jgi:hypothetical protein
MVLNQAGISILHHQLERKCRHQAIGTATKQLLLTGINLFNLLFGATLPAVSGP